MIKKLYYIFKTIMLIIPMCYWFIIFSLFIAVIYHHYYHLKKKKAFDFHLRNKKRAQKFRFSAQRFSTTFEVLDFYYIKNIWFELIQLVIIFSFIFGFLLNLRVLNFGEIYDIWFLFMKKNDNYLPIIIIILSLFIYMKLLNPIIKDIYYKIHLYLFNYKLYTDLINFMSNRYFKNVTGLFTLTGKISHYFLFDILEKQELDYLQKKIKANVILLSFLRKLNANPNKWLFLLKMEQYFWFSLPKIFLFFTLIYDLKNNQLKYIYIAFIVYSIITLYRKYRKFLGENDPEIDLMLSTYFYKNKKHPMSGSGYFSVENEIRHKIKINSANVYEIYIYYKKRILFYLEHQYVDLEFKKSYKFPKSYEFYNIRLVYLGVFILYIFFCYNMSFFNCIIVTLPLFLSCILHEYVYKNNEKYKRLLKIIYLSLMLLAIIIFIWIYLTRHTIYFMRENIFHFGVIITQEFTLQEKYDFINNYLSYLIENNNTLNAYYKNEFIELMKNINIHIKENIINTTTISNLREFGDNFIPLFERIENVYKRHFYKCLVAEIYSLNQDEIHEIEYLLTNISNLLHSDVFYNILIIVFIFWKAMNRTTTTLLTIENPPKDFFEKVSDILNELKRLF